MNFKNFCGLDAFRGILILAPVYFYFLIFAQFAFLHLVEVSTGKDSIQLIMAIMGGSGLFGSFLAPMILARIGPNRLAVFSLLGCSTVGFVAPFVNSAPLFSMVASGIGLSLGLLTVTCAGHLSSLLGVDRLGLKTGVATGLAYACSNLPAVFSATPCHQAWLAAGGCIVALIQMYFTRMDSSDPKIHFSRPFPSILAVGLSGFFALVWLDSACFLVIQSTPSLNHWAWEGSSRQGWNALFHFGAAVLAGILLDQGRWRLVLILAFSSLALGIGCLNHFSEIFHIQKFAPWFYTAGVSFYSTALLLFPSAGATGTNSPRRAAWTYAFAGWVASALGIGMAQHLHQIPDWFVAVSGLALVFALGGKKEVAIPAGGFVSLLGLIYFVDNMHRPTPATTNGIELGRQVYIAEGCIECHSQYIRPGSVDEVLWGPARPIAISLDGSPPLIGNRRQGPDLQNIGNRRSIFWNRLHLENPQALAPGSPMPTYGYLFKGDTRTGECLLLYLQSLGSDTFEQRQAAITAWRPKEHTAPIPSSRARDLFLKNCAVCHGNEGRGNGPFASRVGGDEGPRDLVEGKLELLNPSDRINSIARVIKFGIPKTSMAGHEYFPDADILGLASYVDGLAAKH